MEYSVSFLTLLIVITTNQIYKICKVYYTRNVILYIFDVQK